MKYTKEYLKEHKVAIHIGTNFSVCREIDEYIRQNHHYLYNIKDHHYEERLCIDTDSHCHCSREFYERDGYEVVEAHDFLMDIKEISYDIY